MADLAPPRELQLDAAQVVYVDVGFVGVCAARLQGGGYRWWAEVQSSSARATGQQVPVCQVTTTDFRVQYVLALQSIFLLGRRTPF